MKLKLKFIENNPGLIDSLSEKILGPRPLNEDSIVNKKSFILLNYEEINSITKII